MEVNEFIKYVQLYGANISAWPEVLQPAARAVLSSSKLAVERLEQEAEFEAVAKLRRTLPDDPNFCKRIIDIALMSETNLSFREKFYRIILEIKRTLPIPQPAFAFGVVLLAGFVYGFSSTPSQASDSISGLLYQTQEFI